MPKHAATLAAVFNWFQHNSLEITETEQPIDCLHERFKEQS